MLAQLIAFLNALPILWDIYKRAEKAFGPDWNKKTQDLLDAYGKARNAKSPEDYQNVARAIHDAWTR